MAVPHFDNISERKAFCPGTTTIIPMVSDMEEYKIPAFRFKQKDFFFYSFVENSKTLRKMAYALPKSRDSPEQLQRALSLSRIEDIGRYIRDDTKGVFANNLILNFNASVEFKEDPQNPDFGALIIPKFDENSGKPGYILDGQHRLFGFTKSGGVELDLPVVAIIDAPEDLAYKMFSDINSMQIKVTPVLLQLLKYEIGELEIDRLTAADIVYKLDEEADSVLKDRIKVYPQDKRRWISSTSLGKWIMDNMVGTGAPLNGQKMLKQKSVIKNYFKAFSEEFSNEWTHRTNYILTKAQGIQLMCQLFPNVHQRCILYEKKELTVKAFRNQISKLKERTITLPTGDISQIDWSKERFAPFTSGKAMQMLKIELLKALPPYEEQDSESS